MADAPPTTEKLVRAVGFWGLVALCINAVVGSGVFLLPSKSFALLGQFSLWGPLLFAIPVFILVLCFAEAASHFSEPGGAYLYAKTAFGDFVGFETGFMNTLARLSSLAALSNGIVLSMARFDPSWGEGTPRALLIAGVLILFATIHALGIRYGAGTIYFFTLGKLLPLILFIAVALIAFRHNPFPGSFQLPGPGTNWGDAVALLLFAYAGFENLGVPAGEYKNPRRDLPLALLAGILGIAAVYSLAQLGAMSVIPDLGKSETPIADAAGILLGPVGATLVTIGAILSMMGTNMGTLLEGSRMVYSITDGRRPYRGIAWIHPRFKTPLVAIIILTALAIPVAIAGSFTKLAIFSAVARMTTYLVTCLALPRLRKISEGFRAPGGLLVPILGMIISFLLFFTMNRGNLIGAGIALTVGGLLWLISWKASATT